MAHVLKRHPTLRGTLFDGPHVVKNAKAIDASIAARCQIVGGDFFESVPAGADLYIMKTIIHDWNDDLAVKILANCREVMASGGRILVVDAVIQPGNKFDINKLLDIQMLVLNGGRERTREEFRALFDRAGLSLLKVYPPPCRGLKVPDLVRHKLVVKVRYFPLLQATLLA